MKILAFFFTFCTTIASLQATGRFTDMLVKDADTIPILSTPLEYLDDLDRSTWGLFPSDELVILTSCPRSYIAYWTLKNDSLFLTNIVNCADRTIKADLHILFPNKVAEHGVFAQWYSGTIDIPSGEILAWVAWDFRTLYAYEDVWHFENGVFGYETFYQNNVANSPFWSKAPNRLDRLIYGKVDWENVPKDRNIVAQTFLRFYLKPNFVLDTAQSFTLINGETFHNDENPYMLETIRVAHQIPSWNVYLRKGRVLPNSLSLTFCNHNRRKFRN